MNTVLSVPGLLVSRIEPSGHSVSNHLLPSPEFGLVSLRDLPRGTVSRPPASRRDYSVLGFAID
jgi:hypothetical protein